jgi:cyclopropane fatty-acyl-phospholipid synthase-like methyltransferase
MSFVEHLGLKENYSPNADLEFMEMVKKILKKDGKMILSVPIGKDMLYFENYRIYGEKRFPKLIEGWKIHEYIGFFDHCFLTSYNNENVAKFQPIIVLEK